MKVKMLDYQMLVTLNESSVRANRKQNLPREDMPTERRRSYFVNYYTDHEYAGQRDIRMCVVLKPGVRMAWLDVSPKEFAAIPELELSELEWEAIHCTGTPPWAE